MAVSPIYNPHDEVTARGVWFVNRGTLFTGIILLILGGLFVIYIVINAR